MCIIFYNKLFTAPCAVTLITNYLMPHVKCVLQQIIYRPMTCTLYNILYTAQCEVPIITNYFEYHVNFKLSEIIYQTAQRKS